MRVLIRYSFLLFALVFFGILSTDKVQADTYMLSGKVSNSSGVGISGATVEAIYANTGTGAGSGLTNSSGDYNLLLASGTYNIRVTSPIETGLSSVIALSQSVNTNKVLNFILYPIGTISLSGHIYDPLGNPIPNQRVVLNPFTSNQISTTTDANGYYSREISSGSYNIGIFGDDNPLNVNAPQNYSLATTNPLTFNQSTVLDVTLPVKRVDIHVQGSDGEAVSGVVLKTNAPTSQSFPLGGVSAKGNARYVSPSSPTDSNGNTTLWLFQSTEDYTVTAIPPVGSSYQLKNYSIFVTGNIQQTLTLPNVVTLSGHIYGPLGNPLANQIVTLNPGANQIQVNTDTNGFYTKQISPGTYRISIAGNDNPQSANVPQQYSVYANDSINISQNMILDFTVPAKRVDVHVQDPIGTFVSGVNIKTNAPTNRSIVIGNSSANSNSGYPSGFKTDSSGNVTLWLFMTDGNDDYTVTATPLTGGGYQQSTYSLFVTSDIQKTLTLPKVVTFSGHIYDPLGNPLANQRVVLNPFTSNQISTATDGSGYYTKEVPSGSYRIGLFGDDNNPLTVNAPQNYSLSTTNSLTINQNTVIDFTLPAKRVEVHVQDVNGIPVEGVVVSTNAPTSTSFLFGGVSATGNARYVSPSAPTNSSGITTIWLFQSNNDYTVTATPPAGSIYQQFIFSLSVTDKQTEIISLQYNHAAPITTVTLATEHADGTFSNPTNVTLLATADDGHTVANTFYKIDGGIQQTYSGPFQVSGDGDHVVEYWSVDNSGVEEAHKTKTFTIYQNQAPVVEPLSDVFLNAGGTYSASGLFSDTDSLDWTATVDYGEGAGPEPLVLNPDKTFTLSHQYNTAEEYTVTVVVRDDQQATGQTSATVKVNGAPEIEQLTDVAINFQDSFIKNGTFADDDSTSWIATVDYGEGNGSKPLVLDDKNFVLSYTYQTAGSFDVTVSVTDDKGVIASETFTVTVNASPTINSFPGGTLVEGSTYSHTGFFSDPDSTSWSGTVSYGDGSGNQPLAINPDNTFALNHLYNDNNDYLIIVTITDNQGAARIQTAFLTVTNAAPVVGTITASVNPVQINTATTATVPFSDVGILDAHTAVIAWGDGTTTTCPPNTAACTLTESDGSGSVSGTHAYQSAGVYEITVTITDKDGTSDEDSYQYLSVYNPTPQGLFTAVRKFNSPAGAFTQNPQLAGQVQFGVSAKYTGTTPTGEVSLNFDAANFEFESATVQSFVSANGKGTLLGTGYVNGVGEYTYLVTGIDGTGGGQGLIRFQIKNGNTVVYDTQPGASASANPSTLVTAGQVIVH